MPRESLDGNRWARPALRERRKALGLTLNVAAERAGMSTAFLGDLERPRCRTPRRFQVPLAILYRCTVDDLFAPEEPVKVKLQPRSGDWGLASEAARILGVSKQHLNALVANRVVQRDDGRGRRSYHLPTLMELVPPGSLTLADLREKSAGRLTMNQIRRARLNGRLATFQPWPGSSYRVRDTEAERFLADALREPATNSQPKVQRRPRPDVAEHLRERHAAAAADARQRKEQDGLLDVRDVAERLGVAVGTVHQYAQSSELVPAVTHLGGFRRRLFRDEDVDSFEKHWARDHVKNGNRAADHWLDEDVAIKHYRRRGFVDELAQRKSLSVEEAEAILRARIRQRRNRLMNRRRGPRRSGGPPSYHLEWAQRFVELKEELDEQYVAYHVPGDPPPTSWEVAKLVAMEDYEQHPERWTYDPKQFPREAARKVWEAIKPLLNAVTRNKAA